MGAVLLLLATSGAARQPFNYQWDVKELVKANSDQIELAAGGRVIRRLDASLLRVLYAVKSSIEQAAELSTEFFIVDGDQPNAFAGQAPDGMLIVGINFAMLDLLEHDVHAAAALLGHEIAHLKLDHGAESKRQRNKTGLASAVGGIVLGNLGVPLGGLVSSIAVNAFATQYSRDNEREADYLGAIWAVEAGYEPEGAVRLQKSVYARSKGSPTPFLSSHPSGPERIASLRALAQRLGN